MQRDLTVRLRVNAETGQVTAVREGLDGVDRSARSATGSLGGMRERLLGFAGATVGIYAIVSALKTLAVESWESNAGLDLASSKLLSLVSAGKAYADINGNVVTSVQRANAVQIESAKILQMIRDVNGETALGITDLVQVYALAKPNMDRYNWALKDQIEIVKLVSNTASNFSMGANELSTGIDDLATGTWLANSAFGKMMKTMGISKEEYKLVGDKVSFLKEKLRETGQASDNYATALSNLGVEWDNVVSGMSVTSFSNAKDGIKGLTEQFKSSETVMASSMIDQITSNWSKSWYQFEGSALSVVTSVVTAIPEMSMLVTPYIDMMTLSWQGYIDISNLIEKTFEDLTGYSSYASSELGLLENIIRILSASTVSAGAYIDNLGVYLKMAGLWASNFGESIKINVNVMLAKMMVRVAQAKVAVASMMDFVGLSTDVAIAKANLIKAQNTVSTLEKGGDARISKNKANLASFSKSIKSAGEIVVMMDNAMIKSSADLQKKRDSYIVKKKVETKSVIELANKVSTNATKLAKKGKKRRAGTTANIKKSLDKRETNYIKYLKAIGQEDKAKKLEIDKDIKSLSKTLTKSQLSKYYNAELKKMKGFTQDFSKDFDSLFKGMFKGDFGFKSFFDGISSKLVNPFVQNISKKMSDMLGGIVGNLGVSGSALAGAGIGLATSLISSLFSSKVSEQEIAGAKGRTSFEDESIANSRALLNDVMYPLLNYTKTQTQLLDKMDKNFYDIARGISSSTGMDLTSSAFKNTSNVSSGFGFSKSSTELLSSGLEIGLQSLGDVMDNASIKANGYRTTLEKSSSFWGLVSSEKIKRIGENLNGGVKTAISDMFTIGYQSIIKSSSMLGFDDKAIAKILSAYQIKATDIDLTGLSTKEAQDRLNNYFGEVLSDMTVGLDGVNLLVNSYKKSGEKNYEALLRISTIYEQATYSFGLIGKKFDFKSTVLDVVEGAGGLDRFNSSMSSFVDNFYTDTEKLAQKTKVVKDSFLALGLELPKNNAEYRNLIESFKTGGKEQDKLLGQTLALSSMFAELTKAQDKLKETNTANYINKLKESISSFTTQIDKSISSINTSKDTLSNALKNIISDTQKRYEEGLSTIASLKTSMSAYSPTVRIRTLDIYNSIGKKDAKEVSGTIDSWAKQELDRLTKTQNKEFDIYKLKTEAQNKEIKRVNDIAKTLNSLKDTSLEKLLGLGVTNLSSSKTSFNNALASGDANKISKAFDTYITFAKSSSSSRSEYLSKVAKANAQIQKIDVPQTRTLVEIQKMTEIDTSSIDNVAKNMYQLLINTEEKSLPNIDTTIKNLMNKFDGYVNDDFKNWVDNGAKDSTNIEIANTQMAYQKQQMATQIELENQRATREKELTNSIAKLESQISVLKNAMAENTTATVDNTKINDEVYK